MEKSTYDRIQCWTAASVALIFLLIGIPSADAWEVDPTVGIIPLDHAAEIYRLDGADAASTHLTNAITEYVSRHNDLTEVIPGASSRRLMSMILTQNIANAAHLRCQIDHGWTVAEESLAACDMVGGPWSSTIDLVAAGFARGFLRDEFVGATSGGSAMSSASTLFGLVRVDDNDPEIADFCAYRFAMANFSTARLVRGYIADGSFNSAHEAIDIAHKNYWLLGDDEESGSWLVPSSKHSLSQLCDEEFSDQNSLNAVLTYEAILALLEGNTTVARDVGLRALKDPVLVAYDDDFDHPLLWTLAANHLISQGNINSELFETARALRDDFAADGHVAVDYFLDGPGANDPPSDCSSAGCHYVVSQYFAGFDQTTDAKRELDAGVRLCNGVSSIPCTAIGLALQGEQFPNP